MELSLLALFGAGLATFLTPCVLPLVPIYLAALVGGDLREVGRGGRGLLLGRASLFSVGFIAVFTVLGLGASSVGAALNQHKLLLQGLGAVLILVFGLKFLGVVRISFLDRVVKADDTRFQSRLGSVNALVMGVVFAAGWTPCVGPVLGSVLSYTASATSSPWTGAGYLALYGLGFAVPLLGTALFAEAGVRFLDRIKPQLPRIERVIGVLLVLVAAGLLWDVAKAGSSSEGARSRVAELTRDTRGKRAPAMVELYARDCKICIEMKPIVDELTSQCHGKKVLVHNLDVEAPRNRDLVRRSRIVGVPTFLFFDQDGNEVARLVGRQTREALLQSLSALRGEECPGLGILGKHRRRPGPIDFPTQSQDEEVVSCPSTSTTVTAVTRSSSPSNLRRTGTEPTAPSAANEHGVCSQGSL